MTTSNMYGPIFEYQYGQEIYFFQNRLDQLWVPSNQAPFQWVPKSKRQRREANHSHPPTAEVKNKWSYTSTSLQTFVA